MSFCENPVGKSFDLDEENKGMIVGVVKNFHCLPLTYEMEPLMMRHWPDWGRIILVKIRSEDIGKTIKYAEFEFVVFNRRA